MKNGIWKATRLAVLTAIALGALAAQEVRAGDKTPPNWKVTALGTTVGPGDGTIGPDVDSFAGTSTHLGACTGAGYHYLNVSHFPATFQGVAAYTAANGDQLLVEYQGAITAIDPTTPFLYRFQADVQIVGGTGRLAHATGGGVMTGGFTGVPGEIQFQVLGTLKP
jgi:hypothetical protein